MLAEEVSFSRKELYNLVWSTPLIRLAKTYAISDNGLRKICKKHKIPLPVLGYWQKLQYGKKVHRTKLPEPVREETITLCIRKEGEPNPPSLNTELARKKHELQIDTQLDFEVRDNLQGCDGLISAARKHLNSKEVKQYSWRDGILSSHQGFLHISVSKANLHRALCIVDKLISLLKLRGHMLKVEEEGTFAAIKGGEVEFRCRELMKRMASEDSWHNWEMKPSGKLAVVVYRNSYGSSTFKDGKIRKVEDQILNILARLETVAEEKKHERIQAEIRRKQREEEERVKKEQYQFKEDQYNRFMKMLSKSERWTKAQHLRNYLIAVEQEAASSGALTKDLKDWLQWALHKADWFDPLIEAEDEVFADIDRDKLELPKKSWW